MKFSNSTYLSIRKLESRDRPRVREISCDTAFLEARAEHTLDERELLADCLTLFYTDREPESAFVAEVDGRVVGYLLGAVSTRRFERGMGRIVLSTIIPKLLLGRYRITQKTLRLGLIALWGILKGERDPDLEREYPAHFHINIDTDYRKFGLGSKLMFKWLAYLEEKQIKGVHLSTTSANTGAIRFFKKWGFEQHHRHKSTFWSYVTGKGCVYTKIFVKKL